MLSMTGMATPIGTTGMTTGLGPHIVSRDGRLVVPCERNGGSDYCIVVRIIVDVNQNALDCHDLLSLT